MMLLQVVAVWLSTMMSTIMRVATVVAVAMPRATNYCMGRPWLHAGPAPPSWGSGIICGSHHEAVAAHSRPMRFTHRLWWQGA